MKHFLSQKSVVAFIAITILFLSCGSCTRKEDMCKNIVCIVDFSSSTNSLERQLFYMNVVKNNVIKQLSLRDKISIIPVDRASVTNSSEILIDDLSKKDFEPDAASPMEEDKIIQDNLSKYKDTLSLTFENNFKKAITDRTLQNQGTDLLGAIKNASVYIKHDAKNIVIFLSDMMNFTNTLNMEPSNRQFINSNLESILNKLPGIEMQNATVIVLTANQPNITTEHFELVKSFWTLYLRKNKILLFDYSSASLSKLNELMIQP